MPHQGGALENLQRGELLCHAFEGVIDLLDARYRIDLCDLAGHLGVVHRIHRVLVVQLSDQQLHESILRGRRIGSRRLDAGYTGAGVDAGS